MRTSVLALLAASPLALAAAPAGAATWSAPETVSERSHTFVGPLDLVPAPSAALATWTWQDGINDTGARAGFSISGRDKGGRFGPERMLPGDVVKTGTYGATRAIVLSQTSLPQTGGSFPFRIAVAFGRTDGRIGSRRTITVAPTAYLPQLGASARGSIVSWIQITDKGRRNAVMAATRTSGGRFSRPFTLSGRGKADTVSAAANHGDMVVAFARNGRLLARVRRAGHHWGSIRELAREEGPTQWQVRTAIGVNGRVEVVWRRHQLRRSEQPGRRSIEAAYMPAGHFTFRGPEVVEADGASPPVLIEAPRGFAVAYAHDAAPGAVPRVAVASPRFGPPLDAGPPAGGLRDVRLASGAAGLLAVWIEPRTGGDGDGQGRGALRAVGASGFGEPETVTPVENVHEVAAAPDELVGGGFVAVWSARPEGTGPQIPIADIHTMVRSAVREG